MKTRYVVGKFIEGDFDITDGDGGDSIISGFATEEVANQVAKLLNKLDEENQKLKQVLTSIYWAFPEIDEDSDLNGGDAVDRLNQLWVDVKGALNIEDNEVDLHDEDTRPFDRYADEEPTRNDFDTNM